MWKVVHGHRLVCSYQSSALIRLYIIRCVGLYSLFFFFQAEDGIRDYKVTGVQTCALPISGGCVPELVTDLEIDRPARHVLLTFDDGGRSAVHIGDELAARGWKGHFFIVTDRKSVV